MDSDIGLTEELNYLQSPSDAFLLGMINDYVCELLHCFGSGNTRTGGCHRFNNMLKGVTGVTKRQLCSGCDLLLVFS